MRRTVVSFITILMLSVIPVAAEKCLETLGETVALNEGGSGRLLYRTAERGRFVPAPIQETDVTISVRGLVAETIVAQSFSNPTDEWLEGVYVFPLPAGAAVHAMRLVVGERIIEGQIKEKKEAKKVYEKAKREGRKASLVEQERPNIFTTSVANIGPGETIEVRIEYQQTLHFTKAELELRFPMVVGPRYIPGSRATTPAKGTGWAFDTDEVPDASRVTPPVLHPTQGTVNPVTLAVTLDTGFPISKLVSAYHPVEITTAGENVRRIVLDGPVPADRDFVLRWAPERGQAPRAAVFTEQVDGEFYVLAMVLPPAEEFSEAVRMARETIFVIDTSGSMGGASMGQAQAALDYALTHLAPEDFFNVIEFDSSFRVLFPDSLPAMPAAIDEARAWVRSLRADGGTEIMGALRRALEDETDYTPLRQVVFITDGCVGNEDALFAAIEQHLGRSRLFTVGIGSAPNGHFMERAATFGRGTFTFIGAPAEVEPKMRELFDRLENPVLADIELVWPDPAAEMWPQRIPDLYAGDPVIVAARLGTVAGDLAVSGVVADAEWRVRLPLEVGASRAGVNRLWARRKITALMDEKARGVPEEEVRKNVLPVALEHHLVSKYTSLIAVDVTPSRPADAALKSGAVPTNLPAGWKYEKVFGALPQGGTAARLHLLLALTMIIAGVALRWLKGGSS